MAHRYPLIDFDRLQMYFARPYVIDLENTKGVITLIQPKLKHVVDFGESGFFSTLNIFVTNTTSHRVMLDSINIDWNEMSDFELFCMLYHQINVDASNMLFGDLNFSKFELYSKKVEDKDTMILYNPEDDIEIDERVYQHFSQYLKTCFNMWPEEEFTNDKMLKKWWIQKDKREQERQTKKEEKEGKQSSSIQAMISSCVNHPGFKYNIEECLELSVAQFYDCVKRLQVYESSTAVLKGMYSGMISSKDIDADSYNWMKDLQKN